MSIEGHKVGSDSDIPAMSNWRESKETFRKDVASESSLEVKYTYKRNNMNDMIGTRGTMKRTFWVEEIVVTLTQR